MPTTMLSALSRGYSTWNGELDLYGEIQEKTTLPEVGGPLTEPFDRHKHGVTVTPRTPGRVPHVHPETPHFKADGSLELPKTFLTRKGALLLFAAPDAPPQKDHVRPRMQRKPKKQELIDLSLKLGTLERLSLSVLQYGDQGFDREESSISDKENRWFLKFLHQLKPPDPIEEEKEREGDPLTDRHAQPGEDLKFYLQDLKQRASSRCYGRESSLSSRARSQELRDILQQLEEAWPSGHPHPLSQAPTSMSDGSFLGTDEFFYPRSPSISSESSRAFSGRSKVLSSHKLTASLKSLNYLGRPPSTEEAGDGHSSTGSRAISVQVSSPLGFATEGGERAPMSRLEEEREGDRASVSSSVEQEEDIVLPSDGEEGSVKGSEWPEEMEEQTELGEDGLAKPLQPQYSGVLQDEMDLDEDKLRTSEQGSRPGSRVGSRPGSVATVRSRDVYRPSSVMSSRAASRAGTVPEEEEEVDQEGLDQLMAEENNDQAKELSQQKMDDYLLDHVAKQLENQAQYATSTFSGSVDKGEQDPETLVSLQGPGTVQSGSSVKSSTESQAEALQAVAASVPEPKTSTDAASVASEPRVASAAPTPEPKLMAEPVPPTQTDEVAQPKPEPETVAKEERAPSVVSASGDAAKSQDSGSVRAGETEDGRSMSDADMMSMAMAEAGFGVVRSGLSRSASPAPASSVGVPEAESSALPVVAKEQEEPSKEQVTPKVAKPGVPEKVGEVKKLDVKGPTSPGRKPPVTPRQRSPAKGAKPEKKEAGQKSIVKSLDITSVQPDKVEAEASPAATPASPVKAKEKQKKKESYRPPPPPPRPKSQASKQDLHIPEHMKEALARSDAVAQNELENELMQMHKAMDESLGVSTLITEDAEGLTEEELQQAQQALKERMEEAHRRMHEAVLPDGKKKTEAKPATSAQKKEGKGKKGKKAHVVDPKEEEEKAKKEAAKEQRRLEREKRLEEAQALQQLISQKEAERKDKEAEAARKAKELEEQVELMREEEDAIQQAEEDAREQLLALRKAQREEREQRRKADLEKKKQYAQEKREKERQMMEAARKKEQEMLDRIADAEMRRRMREEDERKRDEEERLAQERYEEEVLLAQQQAEEEEARLQELEKQAEEEAFKRLQAEKEEAERQRQELEAAARKLAEDEERRQQELLAEEQRLEEEKQRQEEEERKRLEEERQRLKELQRLEEEAREKMRAEIDQRREWALKRREVNLDRRKNLDGLRHKQGMTDPWVFSYFVHWSRESYGRPMGEPLVQKGAKGKKPAKKK